MIDLLQPPVGQAPDCLCERSFACWAGANRGSPFVRDGPGHRQLSLTRECVRRSQKRPRVLHVLVGPKVLHRARTFVLCVTDRINLHAFQCQALAPGGRGGPSLKASEPAQLPKSCHCVTNCSAWWRPAWERDTTSRSPSPLGSSCGGGMEP